MKSLILIPCFLLLALQAGLFAQSPQKPERFTHVNRDRAAVQKAYHEVYLKAKTYPTEWTEEGNCKPGKLSAATRKARLQEINYFRAMAGLKPVTLDPEESSFAQAAAHLMRENNALSHQPPKEWKCYTTEGARGAGASNLGLGCGIAGYIQDYGSSNESCGHRMWLLRSRATTFGFGATDRSSAIYVFGSTTQYDTLPEFVAWPPAGFVPEEIIGDRWTFSVPGADARYDKATVQLSMNGKPIPLNYKQYTSYGDGGLSFELTDFHRMQVRDQKIKVHVRNIMVGNTTHEYQYEVILFKAETDELYVLTNSGETKPTWEIKDDSEVKILDELPFADRKLSHVSELEEQENLSQLVVKTLKAQVVRDIVYDADFSRFAARVSSIRKEKNPDAARLHAWATAKIKQHLATHAGLSETQTATAANPKFLIVEIKNLIPLTGSATFAEIAKSMVEKLSENPELRAFTAKYRSIRRGGFGWAVKQVVREGKTYAGIYATLVIAPARLSTGA